MEFFSQYWVVVLVGFFGLLTFFGAFFAVPQQELFLIERLGKFVRTAQPGLNFKLPFFETVRGKMSLRVKEIDIPGDFKTKDNVFIQVMVRVQYLVLPTKIYDAFYRLTNPEQQIAAFVLNTVRAEVAGMNLQDVFLHQDAIGTAVNMQLDAIFRYDEGHRGEIGFSCNLPIEFSRWSARGRVLDHGVHGRARSIGAKRPSSPQNKVI
ncbi:MAG: hypothetical protein K8R88_07925 [Armatimonadetes bacterium]|nr:hypothetical protein [Armatimonadota bacterium]